MVKPSSLSFAFALVAWCASLLVYRPSLGDEPTEASPTRSTSSLVGEKVSDKDRAIVGRSTHSVWFDAKEGTVRPIRDRKSVNVDDRHDVHRVEMLRQHLPGWWTSLKNLLLQISSIFFFKVGKFCSWSSWSHRYWGRGYSSFCGHGLSFQSYGGKMSRVSIART